jgi:threonine dehydrogenase-like Zn-dependent dehydrogenase
MAPRCKVAEMPDAIIEQPTDVLVKITATNICGSDLHMYQGRTDMESGRILGHENMGRVVEIGKAVTQIKVGDMVCLPFNIGCGHCRNCESSLTAFLSYNESGIRWCCLWFCRNGSTVADKPNTFAFLMVILIV